MLHLKRRAEKGSVAAFVGVLAVLALVIVLENTLDPNKNIIVFTALKKGAVYALVAASMNLLNGFTGLFSLGQAGFMLLGGYAYAILTIPVESRESVYYIFDGSAINFPSQKRCRTSSAAQASAAPLASCSACS